MNAARLVTLLLVLIFSSTSPHFSVTETKVIDSFGIWTLHELGYPNLIFPGQEAVETISTDYILPEDAAQGPDHWYIIHLNARIEFSEQSEDGIVYLHALTNKYACALVELKTKKAGDSLTIEWTTVDLLNGAVKHSTSSLGIDVSFSNYLQIAGIKPGLNSLTFELEKRGGATVKRAEVLDSSGIEYTAVGPPELEMSINFSESSVRVGDNFAIEFDLKNTGGTAAKDVVVRTIYPEQGLQILGDNSFSVPSLDSSFKGTFNFKALMEGQYEVIIVVDTKSGIRRPSTRIAVPVGSAGHPWLTAPLTAAIVFGLFLAYFAHFLMKSVKRK